MEFYNINFDKIKYQNINGIYFEKKQWINDILDKVNKKYYYHPISFIDESIDEHNVQILFLLKEYFTNKKNGFTGWKSFSRETLCEIISCDKNVYINEYENGEIYYSKFPKKINFFLENYCMKK